MQQRRAGPDRGLEAVAEFKRELDLRKTGEVNVHGGVTPIAGNGSGNGAAGGWVIIDGRGKSCAGVIAALSYQLEADRHSFVEAILADALNIYDVILWTENSGHHLLTQRKGRGRDRSGVDTAQSRVVVAGPGIV